MKVLVSDSLSKAGIEILQQSPDIEVDVKDNLAPEELKDIIKDFDALIIRSKTKVTADIIEHANNLKVIGRAGIGLDNIDISAASKKGIVVMNAPEGNTITAAEHAVAMIMALSRNIPQATASLKLGNWEKNKLEGCEIFNKTLGIIGIGRIGKLVAERARGLFMKVIAYDPFIKPDTIEKMNIEPVSFDELLHRSDYITIHTPLTSETTNIINKDTISRMKQGAMLINCARGGIVNEDDLYDALKSGRLAGAALDVFSKEPPGKIKLMDLPHFICTPHLGASTREAQDKVAKDIAEEIVNYLLYGSVKNAVNVPSISPELITILRPYAVLAERMGALQTQLSDSPIREVHLNYLGMVAAYDVTPLTNAALKGLLSPILKDQVNYVNASLIAAEREIRVMESKSKTSEDFSSLITFTVKTSEGDKVVSGTIFGNTFPRIVRINNFHLEAIPEGHNLLINNLDRPGVIGKITSTLGKYNINISRMAVGEEKREKQNVIFLATNVTVNDEILKILEALEDVLSVRKIEL
jgi:D-3-phosphoglycerate dehydrogenase / 2-oxoglutarate reductase